jgi:hypothetical protein
MLDESRKGGLSLILCHQRFGRLGGTRSCRTHWQAKLRSRSFSEVFATRAASLAQDMLLPTINERQIVETYYRMVTRHRLERLMSFSSSSSTSGGRTTSRSSTDSEGGHGSETLGYSDANNAAFSQTTAEQAMLMPYYEYERGMTRSAAAMRRSPTPPALSQASRNANAT